MLIYFQNILQNTKVTQKGEIVVCEPGIFGFLSWQNKPEKPVGHLQ